MVLKEQKSDEISKYIVNPIFIDNVRIKQSTADEFIMIINVKMPIHHVDEKQCGP